MHDATLIRRLKAATYEAMLLFGVYFIAAYAFLALTQANFQQNPVQRTFFQMFLFVVFAAYFAYSWAAGRKTLAQKTWGVRIVLDNGENLTVPRAFARYCLAWLSLSLLLAGYFYAFLDKDRKFLHDRLCGTRVITTETA